MHIRELKWKITPLIVIELCAGESERKAVAAVWLMWKGTQDKIRWLGEWVSEWVSDSISKASMTKQLSFCNGHNESLLASVVSEKGAGLCNGQQGYYRFQETIQVES